MNLEYKDRLISISRIFIGDLKIGELRALRYSEKVLSIYIRGVENGMEEKEIIEEVREFVGECYIKCPKSKITLALSQMLDILIIEEQKERFK